MSKHKLNQYDIRVKIRATTHPTNMALALKAAAEKTAGK